MGCKRMALTSQEIVLLAALFAVVVMLTRIFLGRRKLNPYTKASRMARYIRITRDRAPLEVAEIQVYDQSNTNVAPLYAKLTQSSIRHNKPQTYGPNVIIDGNISGMAGRGELATTKMSDQNPSIELDLRHDVNVSRITLYLRDHDKHPNPTSEWIDKHCKNIRIEVLCSLRTVLWRTTITAWQRMYDFPLRRTPGHLNARK